MDLVIGSVAFWVQAQVMYFTGILAGYLGQKVGGVKVVTFRNDFWRGIEVIVGDFVVADGWLWNDPTIVVGSTIVSYQGRPVWRMNYGGFYETGVTPFLKKVLAETYREGKFIGGRGPQQCHGEVNGQRLLYTNAVDPSSTFTEFRGIEVVQTIPTAQEGARIVGRHEYFGRALVPTTS